MKKNFPCAKNMGLTKSASGRTLWKERYVEVIKQMILTVDP